MVVTMPKKAKNCISMANDMPEQKTADPFIDE